MAYIIDGKTNEDGDAHLEEANFFEADLLGADFAGAYLSRASFLGARNLPRGLSEHIGRKGRYEGPEQFEPPKATSASMTSVFISKPGALTVGQREVVRALTSLLADEAINIATVERDDYANAGAVAEVRRVLSGCAGAIVVGFRQIEIRAGTWRAGTAEAEDLEETALPTAWNHVEAGMAAMVGLPTLCIVERGVAGGLFDLDDVDHAVITLDVHKPDYSELRRVLTTWCASVREARP